MRATAVSVAVIMSRLTATPSYISMSANVMQRSPSPLHRFFAFLSLAPPPSEPAAKQATSTPTSPMIMVYAAPALPVIRDHETSAPTAPPPTSPKISWATIAVIKSAKPSCLPRPVKAPPTPPPTPPHSPVLEHPGHTISKTYITIDDLYHVLARTPQRKNFNDRHSIIQKDAPSLASRQALITSYSKSTSSSKLTSATQFILKVLAKCPSLAPVKPAPFNDRPRPPHLAFHQLHQTFTSNNDLQRHIRTAHLVSTSHRSIGEPLPRL